MARTNSNNRGPVNDGVKSRRRAQWLSMLEEAHRMNIAFDRKRRVERDVAATASRAPRQILIAAAPPVTPDIAAAAMARMAGARQPFIDYVPMVSPWCDDEEELLFLARGGDWDDVVI